MADELDQWEARNLFYKAVHANDPEPRRWIANYIKLSLESGDELSEVDREWLAWVLGRLIEKDAVPHVARGNRIKNRARFKLTLRLAEAMHKSAPGPVTKRLQGAATILNVSYGTARSLYYTDTCRDWMETFSKESPSK